MFLKDGETYIVCLEFTNKKSCSFYLFELNIIGIHTVSHLADQYNIHKVINDVKKRWFVLLSSNCFVLMLFFASLELNASVGVAYYSICVLEK